MQENNISWEYKFYCSTVHLVTAYNLWRFIYVCMCIQVEPGKAVWCSVFPIGLWLKAALFLMMKAVFHQVPTFQAAIGASECWQSMSTHRQSRCAFSFYHNWGNLPSIPLSHVHENNAEPPEWNKETLDRQYSFCCVQGSKLLPSSRYEQQKQAYEAGYSAAILKTDVPGSVGQPGIVMTTPRHRRRKKDPDMPRRNM